VKTQTKTITNVTKTITLTGKDIAKLFSDSIDIDLKNVKYICQFSVPSGGDYSSCVLDVDEYPIVLTLIETTVKES
jgi:hypothetical protein